MEDVRFPVILWLVPLVPIAAIAVLLRDTRASATPAAPATPTVRRASAFSPDGDRAAMTSAAIRVLRERAASPRSSAHELEQLACLHAHLRPVVAANPATPANVLSWLSTLGDVQIDAAIASRRSVASVATPVSGVRRVEADRVATAVTVPSLLG
ncbi:variant leucine-rich repeat-containing protein [Demequina activiva]|uniref:Leucine rich repeat variant domain-containing protein n=1 Tax=Demequina activiva TaxID=1582364 RepID=A0A919UFR7_9MICO|nr:hypothetical protein [Demequina activiva]GIG54012.1 hypothetical protein Dac01nite_07640 [Demequina activiva]